jgi:O-methyltransferase
MMSSKLSWWKKLKRSIIKRLVIRFVNSSDSYVIQHLPEFLSQTELNFSQLREYWIHQNEENNDKDLIRLLFLISTLEELKSSNIPGSLAELGVYRGNSAKIIHSLCPERNLYLFDTFTGFDARDGSDAGGFSDTSIEKVREFVGADDTIHYLQGYFPDTASGLPPDTRFALVHLDADLYPPMKSGLEYFYDKLEPGGFLILHDYDNPRWPGVMHAAQEFFPTNPKSS